MIWNGARTMRMTIQTGSYQKYTHTHSLTPWMTVFGLAQPVAVCHAFEGEG